MKRSAVFAVPAICVLFAGCGVKEASYNTTTTERVATVSEVRVTNVQTAKRTGDPGGDAAAGALVGSLVGAPTLGAVVGAASSEAKEVNISEPFACAVFVKAEGGDMVFSSANVGLWEREFLKACSLVRTGDKVKYYVQDTVKSVEGKEVSRSTLYLWKYLPEPSSNDPSAGKTAEGQLLPK